MTSTYHYHKAIRAEMQHLLYRAAPDVEQYAKEAA